jgi:alkanesulfonate monooxygenase SsuD/methylene tetrahydromethanopterin reductase-like flavin-dependent oxidoreductase (luciferase family)
MGLVTALRLNMTNAPGATHGERYAAALDMAAYADARGFTGISCEEHHLAVTGWLPSPLVMAAAVIARTTSVAVTVNALLIPLYEPLRLAEDIAVLDNLSRGRFSFIAGMGYRPEEYAALGKDWSRRGQLMDECIEVLVKAWDTEPFVHNGQLVDPTPKPHSRPRPFFFVGGMSNAAARRAARFGLPFAPPMAMPEVEATYRRECDGRGHRAIVYRPESGSTVTLLSHDPDAAWKSYREYLANEADEYHSWKREGVLRPHDGPADSDAQPRRHGGVEILTPDELIGQIRSGRMEVVMNPLMGGLPLEVGWASLRLLGEDVLPAVTKDFTVLTAAPSDTTVKNN